MLALCYAWRMVRKKRLFLLGWDGVPPALVFDRFWDCLPNLRRCAQQGAFGPLGSCWPPITVPAWAVMFSGNDPGRLGVYGFREPIPRHPQEFSLIDSTKFNCQQIWDVVGSAGLKTVLHGVPHTFPPSEVNGWCVSGFLAPNTSSTFTFPAELSAEVLSICPQYSLDVDEYRTNDKEGLLKRIYDYTKNHYRLTRYLITSKDWDFFVDVNVAPDRLHHGFWQNEESMREYYQYLDSELGELLSLLDEDTALMLVSDHGAKAAKGGFLINEWLIDQNYLVLREYPKKMTPWENLLVDWEKTTVWAWGGYYARVFVKPEMSSDFKEELRAKLRDVNGPAGQMWQNQICFPKNLYKITNGCPPDIMAAFDDLSWRPLASVGYNSFYLDGNDTGSDLAVHDWQGVALVRGVSLPSKLPDVFFIVKSYFNL